MQDYRSLMMGLHNEIIEVDIDGNVLWLNTRAQERINHLGIASLGHITQLSPSFSPDDFHNHAEEVQVYYCGEVQLKAIPYVLKAESVHYFYVFSRRTYNGTTLQMILDCIDDIVVICDQNGITLGVNAFALKLINETFGYHINEVIGKDIDQVFGKYIPDGPTTVRMVSEKREIMQRVVQYTKGPTILYTASPVFQDGEFTNIILTGRDVSQLSQLQDELERSRRLNVVYQSKLNVAGRADCNIIYSSKVIDDLLSLAIRVSKTDSSVLIMGESGVGKEEFAKFIHGNSLRKDKKMVAINCAAIPQALMESELFGYEEGAFTGSRRGGRKGILEEADGGTVFLDEIGELPLTMQSKLLRVIQEGIMRPVGSNRNIRIDVRYISATNLTQEKLHNEEIFRQDLFYRLSVIPMIIPPLRERREDIIPLLEHFLMLYNSFYQRKIALSPSGYKVLYNHQWQGNIRELKNTVERIVVLSNDNIVMEEDLINLLEMESKNIDSSDHIVKVKKLLPLHEAQEQLEQQLFVMALEQYGSVPKAAKALGIPPVTLYRKLKR